MGLSAAFNKSDYTLRKDTDAVLTVQYSVGGYYRQLTYDFIARVMMINNPSYPDGGISVIPFSQLDRETLVEMRDRLVDLKGNPPELPPEAPATQAANRKFNL